MIARVGGSAAEGGQAAGALRGARALGRRSDREQELLAQRRGQRWRKGPPRSWRRLPSETCRSYERVLSFCWPGLRRPSLSRCFSSRRPAAGIRCVLSHGHGRAKSSCWLAAGRSADRGAFQRDKRSRRPRDGRRCRSAELTGLVSCQLSQSPRRPGRPTVSFPTQHRRQEAGRSPRVHRKREEQ